MQQIIDNFIETNINFFQLEYFIRILLAGICGAVIGLERRKRFKDAGIRTHLILAIGCAVIMIVSKYAFSDVLDYDAARVASNIITGVGFLGAGVIFVKSGSVRGLTTAAGIWTTAAIGMAIGALAGAMYVTNNKKAQSVMEKGKKTLKKQLDKLD